jgi:tetratricopeptide (TPR) repeat protein
MGNSGLERKGGWRRKPMFNVDPIGFFIIAMFVAFPALIFTIFIYSRWTNYRESRLEKQAQRAYQNAESALSKNDLQRAIQHLKKYLKLRPDDGESYLLLSRAYMKAQSWSDAEKVLFNSEVMKLPDTQINEAFELLRQLYHKGHLTAEGLGKCHQYFNDKCKPPIPFLVYLMAEIVAQSEEYDELEKIEIFQMAKQVGWEEKNCNKELFQIAENLYRRYAHITNPQFFVQRKVPLFSEMISEPKNNIYGRSVNVCLYRGQDQSIAKILHAGHANATICRRVSSLFYNTYLELASQETDLLVAGATHITPAPLSGSTAKESTEKDIEKAISLFHDGHNLMEALFKLKQEQENDPITQFLQGLNQLKEEMGLVSVTELPLEHYEKTRKKIEELVERAKTEERPIVYHHCSDPNEPAESIIFMPYYLLNDSSPSTILTLALDESEFTCEDFQQLRSLHRTAIVREMKGDAELRKQIYEEWKKEHEEMKVSWEDQIQQMSEAEKNAPTLPIHSQVSYNPPRIIRLENPDYVSPHEYLTKILPGLIHSDQQWINRMDELLKKIDSAADERGGKIDKINLSALVDSFLRNWELAFLEASNKQLYENWLSKRRSLVWIHLYRLLSKRSINFKMLCEENVVFNVIQSGSRFLITPYYLLDGNDHLIIFDKANGVIQYINYWQRRKPEYFNWKNPL